MNRPPTDEERLLLRAATGQGEEALEAWRGWRARTDFERLGAESVHLVPLLYRNLSRLGAPPAELKRYASVYRHSWAKNRLAFQAGARAIERLAAHGIDALVLKGAAASTLHYRDDGVRAMEDVDVLVRRARLEDTLKVLGESGWEVAPDNGPRALSAPWLTIRHSAGFRDAKGRSFDLHWYVSADMRIEGADEAFWAAAVPMQMAAVETRALCATDHLYHVIAHAAWSTDPHIRWAADAMAVLRGPGSGPVDWPRLVGHAMRRRMVLPVRRALRWLQRELGAPVPDAPLAELDAVRVGRLAQLELDYAHRLPPRPNAASKIALRLWFAYERSTAQQGAALALGFPAFLARYFGVTSPWQVPLPALRRGLERVRSHGL